MSIWRRILVAAFAAAVFTIAYIAVFGIGWRAYSGLVVSGLVFGSVYALVALAYNIVFATRGIINFAQGELVVLGALLSLTLMTAGGQPAIIALILTAAVVAAAALAVEWLAVRPIPDPARNLAWIMSTFGFGVALKEVITFVWGREPVAAPKLLPFEGAFNFGVLTIQPGELLVIVAAVLATVAYEVFTRTSIYGLAMRAVSFDRRTASLVGVDPTRIVTLAYGLSGAVAALAGLVIAPITFADPQFGIVLAISGFIAAVIGGLGNVPGGFFGGLLLGLLGNLATGVFPVEWKDVFVFAALLIVMVVRPRGLLAR